MRYCLHIQTIFDGDKKWRYSKLKNKTQTIKRAKVITVSKAQGKLSYKYVSAKKGKKNFKKFFKINKKTGKVTVKRGLKKGTYKVKVKVKAAGNTNYKASKAKTVTFKIIVKWELFQNNNSWKRMIDTE